MNMAKSRDIRGKMPSPIRNRMTFSDNSRQTIVQLLLPLQRFYGTLKIRQLLYIFYCKGVYYAD